MPVGAFDGSEPLTMNGAGELAFAARLIESPLRTWTV